MLICPVRACGLALVRHAEHLRCERGHSFDLARSGYANLLQPQDRRSASPGDTAEVVRARRWIHDTGVTQPLLNAIGAMLHAAPSDSVLDAGCGDGFYLGSLQEKAQFAGHGVDISTSAVDAAARRYANCEWVVANADRQIPYGVASMSAVMSITARRNPSEFRRVLRSGGKLLLAIPAPDDLVEIRGAGAKDRVLGVMDEFAMLFRLTDQQRATTSADLNAEAVRCILHSVYRPLHSQPPVAMRVTFSLDLLLWTPL